MAESDAFWDFYWETRLRDFETLGKREAILTGSRLIRSLHAQVNRPLRVLEPGCGEGQVVGILLNSHDALCSRHCTAGIDYNPRSLARCRKDYPLWQWVEGDFTNPNLLASLGEYDLVILVNALHEVFSDSMLSNLGAAISKQRTAAAFSEITRVIAPGGRLLLFDGLEPPGSPDEILTIRFVDGQARAGFETFAAEYKPFHITYQNTTDPLRIRLPRRDFTRYITKSIFLGKALWQSEQRESYQYFEESEFREVFGCAGFQISEMRTMTVNAAKWQRVVQPVGFEFPAEHILIVGEKK